MSDIVIIGGHGKIALLAAPILLAAGHSVRSVIRNPDHAADVAATGTTPLLLDIEQSGTEAIAEALQGADTVIWSAGAGGGSPERTAAVDHQAAVRSMDAAAAVGAKRYVMVSYFGAATDHGVPADNSFFAYAQAKAAADEYLRSTDLTWTILGPSALTDDEATGLISTTDTESGSVPRADVARVIAAVLADPTTVRRTVTFNAGTVPIAQALSA